MQTNVPYLFRHGYYIHGSANKDFPLGRNEHWAQWIQRALDMGMDGFKLVIGDDAGDAQLGAVNAPTEWYPIEQWNDHADWRNRMGPIRLAMRMGLCVIVRLYRDRPNPGTLSAKHLAVLDRLVAMGVRLYETNNEPNLTAEWQDDVIPPGAAYVVATCWLQDAATVIAHGGYPAIPAMAPGGNVDDMAMLNDFLGAIAPQFPALKPNIWMAVHDYILNHPLDYPDDAVNRQGTPVSQAEYDTHNWGNLTLAQVNAERVNGRHLLGTIMDPGESNSVRKAEAAMGHLRNHFGANVEIPVIGTEGGAVMDIGMSGDPRYPRLIGGDETLHAEVNVAQAQRMMLNKTPAYYWGYCYWIMANRMMEGQPIFEAHAWYPWSKPDGVVAVQRFKEMPKVVRQLVTTPVVPPITPPPSDVDAALRKIVAEDMALYPWGIKYAYAHGLIPWGDEARTVVNGVTWFAQPAYSVSEAKRVLVKFQAGKYTDAETSVIQW
jgi:hypothetical protein